ncbi:MAG: FtsX-like permease family protein [Microscillaceae bacterium]|nr:FtsX-like permease family protein [Microscillaceae bacterium]
MWFNYFITALRHFYRQKFYTLLNVIGLSCGLTCSFLLLLYVVDELSYDQHYRLYNQLYRVNGNLKVQGRSVLTGRNSANLAKALKAEFPTIPKLTRLYPYGRTALYEPKSGRRCYDEIFTYADGNVFDLLEQTFLAGSPDSALVAPRTMVLTESMARFFFDSPQKALHQWLEVDDEGVPYRITGVIRDLSHRNSLRFHVLTSISTLERDYPGILDNWGLLNCITLLQLPPQLSKTQFEAQGNHIFDKYVRGEVQNLDIRGSIFLQPFGEIHLHHLPLMFDATVRSNPFYVYAYGLLGGLLLLVAAINYLNLSTARSGRRAKEIGIRKAAGASRGQLFWQFMTESVLMCFLAFLLSLIWVEWSLPAIALLLGHPLPSPFSFPYEGFFGFLGLAIFLGLLSGAYPALYLASLRPALVLKSRLRVGALPSYLRKILVVLQFSISLVLLMLTGIIFQQLRHIQHTALGKSKTQTLVLEIEGETCHRYLALKQALQATGQVESLTAATSTLGSSDIAQNIVLLEQNGELKEWLVHTMKVDADFVRTLGLKIVQGRDFDPQRAEDSLSVLVNETLARKLGWKKALGKRFINLRDFDNYSLDSVRKSSPLRVIGVLEDFHFQSKHSPIAPLVLYPVRNRPFWYPARLYIQMRKRTLENALAAIKNVYEKFDKKRPFKAQFLDQTFARQYESETKQYRLFLIFTYLTFLIAILGLLGLATFASEQRSKEIGVRKVLGAGFSQVFWLLIQDFLRLILLSWLIALPIALYLSHHWLQNFAYHIALAQSLYIFLGAGVLVLLGSFLTIAALAYRTASLRPSLILRYE